MDADLGSVFFADCRGRIRPPDRGLSSDEVVARELLRLLLIRSRELYP